MGILDWFRRKKRKMKVPPAPATCDIRWQPSVLRPARIGCQEGAGGYQDQGEAWRSLPRV